MKKILVLLLAIFFAHYEASAKVIDNFNVGNKPLLIPEPQKITVGTKTVPIPALLTVSADFKADYETFLIAEALQQRFGERHATQAPQGFCKLNLTDKNVPENPEGYTLAIHSQGIVINSRDERGLFYGVQTLCDLIRHLKTPEFPELTIEDWPDLKVRGFFHIWLGHYTAADIRDYCTLIKQFAALKYNTIYLELNSNFPYKKNPFTKRSYTLTWKEIQLIKDTCKANKIEIVPFLQVLSHDSWLKDHPLYETEISEGPSTTPWSSASCPSRPLPKQLNLMAIDEQIEAFTPKSFCIAMDEISQCPWGVCPICRTKDKFKLWEEATLFYTNYLLKKNVIPAICYDSYYPGCEIKGEFILPKLDPRVIIINWDYKPNPEEMRFQYYQQYKFPMLGMSYCAGLENTRSLPAMVKKYKNQYDGVILSFWHYQARLRQEFNITPEAVAGTVTAGDFQWKVRETPVSTLSYDPGFEGVRRIFPQRIWAGRGETQLTPVPMAKSVNAVLGIDANFPQFTAKALAHLKRELASTQEHFQLLTRDTTFYALLASSDSTPLYPAKQAALPLNSKVETLSLLLTTDTAKKLYGDKFAYKPTFARLEFAYADGTAEYLPLTYRYNIVSWNSLCGGNHLRLITRAKDKNDALCNFFALDWKNPHPEKMVKELKLFTQDTSDLSAAILAVSASGNALTLSAESQLPTLTPPQIPEAKQEAEKYYIIQDFSKGMNGTVFGHAGKHVTAPTFSIIEDDAAPHPGNVIRINVPKATDEFFTMNRVMIDIPFDPNAVNFPIKTIVFDYKIDSPESSHLPSTYLMRRNAKGGYLQSIGFGPNDGKWHTACISVEAMVKYYGGISQKEANTVRLSLFMKHLTQQSCVYFGNVGFSSKVLKTPNVLVYDSSPELSLEK